MVASAGILPMSRDDRGDVVFLVGKDLRDGVFSDFGGKTEAVDQNDPVNTATREFYEETLGSLCNSPYDIRQRVRELSVCLFGFTKNQHVYRMYVMEVPFCAEIPARFKKMMNFLKYKNIGSNYIEKTELVWCTLDELIRIPKRKVFTDTVNSNMNALRRIAHEPWRALCDEYRSHDTSPHLGTSPSGNVGKYIHPRGRHTALFCA
jgi:hypothetical protein